MIAPLAVAALVTGLAQALLGGWSPLRDRWVTIKLTVTATLTVVVFTVLEPALADLSAAATDRTPITDAQRIRLVLASTAAITLLILNV